MKLFTAVLTIAVSIAFIPPAKPVHQAGVPGTPATIQSLPEALIGNWSGILIFNDRRRNFTRVPARLRFTGGVLYLNREEIELPFLSFPSLRDWRADYEVIGTAVYLNPQIASLSSDGTTVIGDITIQNDVLEGVARGCCQVRGDPFGPSTFPTALRMRRE